MALAYMHRVPPKSEFSARQHSFSLDTLSTVMPRHRDDDYKQSAKSHGYLKTPPPYLTAPNGDVVPYPIGIERPIVFPIVRVGTDTLKSFLPENVPGASLINRAKETYLNVFRPQLMSWRRGAWIVCSSEGELLMVRTQKEAMDLAYRYFQPADRSVDCYVTCVGSEFTVGICMDDVVSPHKEMQKQDNVGLYLPVEFSPDGGKTFTSYDMKHASGADFVGVPADCVSQFTLKRAIGEDINISGPNGELMECNKYRDLLFRLNGLVTKTDIVQLTGPRWLLGQPIYSRYRNIIDKTAKDILTMEPLPSEMNHE